MARKKQSGISPTDWREEGLETRSQKQWREVGYNRASDWLHEYDDIEPAISAFRKVLYEVARIRGYMAAAETYGRHAQIAWYLKQPDRREFVCAVARWTETTSEAEKTRLLRDLVTGKIPIPEGGNIKWKDERRGHAVARMVQMNILTRSLLDAIEEGYEIDDPWVLARVAKGGDDS